MCCLGFLCLARGFTDEDIRNLPMPDRIKVDGFIPGLTHACADFIGGIGNTPFAEEAAKINDSRFYSDEQREEALIGLFTRHPEHPIALRFEGEGE